MLWAFELEISQPPSGLSGVSVGLYCETPLALWGDCCLMEGGVMPPNLKYLGIPGNAKLQLGHLLAELGLSVPRELWSFRWSLGVR